MLKLRLTNHWMEIGEDRISIRNAYSIGHYEVVQFIHDEIGNEEARKDYAVRAELGVEYMPEILFNENFWKKDKDPEFKIQTTAYGTKTIDEIEKVIAGYQEAVEVVKVITKEFLK